MKHLVAMLAVSGFLALAAPAAADPPELFTAETGQNQYIVIARGDRQSERRDVATAAMRRAAQLALETGNQWFIVSTATTRRVDLNSVGALSALTEGATSTDAAPDINVSEASQSGGHGATAGSDPGAVGVGTHVDPRVLERRPARLAYQTTLLIQVGSGNAVTVDNAGADMQIFDAAAISEQLGRSGN